jgi:chromosome segregation ATPase
MKEYYSEIAITVAGVITTASAWFLGGKQNHKNASDEVLTRGADQIVDTSNKLLETLKQLLDEERQRSTAAVKHHQECETSLREHKQLLDKLNRRIRELEKKVS